MIVWWWGWTDKYYNEVQGPGGRRVSPQHGGGEKLDEKQSSWSWVALKFKEKLLKRNNKAKKQVTNLEKDVQYMWYKICDIFSMYTTFINNLKIKLLRLSFERGN